MATQWATSRESSATSAGVNGRLASNRLKQSRIAGKPEATGMSTKRMTPR